MTFPLINPHLQGAGLYQLVIKCEMSNTFPIVRVVCIAQVLSGVCDHDHELLNSGQLPSRWALIRKIVPSMFVIQQVDSLSLWHCFTYLQDTMLEGIGQDTDEAIAILERGMAIVALFGQNRMLL